MQLIILSGGSGKRLWPLSNEARSKQFLQLLNNGDKKESMVERVYRQINDTLKNVEITISTSKTQEYMITKQMGNNLDIVCEPSRRNTFPAIMLASAFLAFKKNINLDEPIVILPIDSYVEDRYFKSFEKMYECIKNNEANICLMGVEPTYPSSKFGYIIPDENNKVLEFKEKPTETLARQYIEKNGLWNCGVFCMKLGYLIDILKQWVNSESYDDIYDNFEKLNKNSIDYEVIEKEKNIKVIKYDGIWKDLGTWNTLTEEMDDEIVGNVIMGEECSNTHVINELHIPIVALGLKNIVVAASPDGIIVSDKHKSSYNKPYVEQIKDRVKYEERQWGKYTVLEENEKMLVKIININEGRSLSYQKHKYRDEVWTIISGTGVFVLNGVEKKIGPSDVLNIPRSSLHSIKAFTEIEMIEVQLGSNFIEQDIERFDYEWKAKNII